ncbi:hypothetical protein FQZ97_1096320 [compost metagenome]
MEIELPSGVCKIMNDQEIRALAESMIEEDHPLVDWDTQQSAIAEIPSNEDVANMLLDNAYKGTGVGCYYREKIISTHERLIREALARMEEQHD